MVLYTLSDNARKYHPENMLEKGAVLKVGWIFDIVGCREDLYKRVLCRECREHNLIIDKYPGGRYNIINSCYI